MSCKEDLMSTELAFARSISQRILVEHEEDVLPKLLHVGQRWNSVNSEKLVDKSPSIWDDGEREQLR
jgi:hypothetical protein